MGKKIVNVTDAAAARLRTLVGRGDGKVVRLTVKASGCAGHKYDLDYADEPMQGDEVVKFEGGAIYVDPLSLLYVLGTTVDWQQDRFSQQFTFSNPNETSRCGCGESVSFKGVA